MNSKTKIKDSIRALKDNDEIIITDGPQLVNILNNSFGSVFCEEDLSSIPTCESKTSIKCPDPIFNESVIRLKLKNLNVNNPFGVDNVQPRVLKECSNSMAKALSIIFNRSYADGIFSNLWSRANVTPLFKKR